MMHLFSQQQLQVTSMIFHLLIHPVRIFPPWHQQNCYSMFVRNSWSSRGNVSYVQWSLRRTSYLLMAKLFDVLRCESSHWLFCLVFREIIKFSTCVHAKGWMYYVRHNAVCGSFRGLEESVTTFCVYIWIFLTFFFCLWMQNHLHANLGYFFTC